MIVAVNVHRIITHEPRRASKIGRAFDCARAVKRIRIQRTQPWLRAFHKIIGGGSAVNPAAVIHAPIAIKFQEAKTVRREEVNPLQPHVDVVAALDRVGGAAVWGIFGTNDNEVAQLLRITFAPAGNMNANPPQPDDFHAGWIAIVTAQRAGVGTKDFVFEVARLLRRRITVEQLNVVNFFVIRKTYDASLRERQRIVINHQPANRHVGAVRNCQRAGRLGADHFKTVRDDLDILELAQHEVLAIMRRHPETSGRQNNAVFAGMNFRINKFLQVENGGRQRVRLRENRVRQRKPKRHGNQEKLSQTIFHQRHCGSLPPANSKTAASNLSSPTTSPIRIQT